MLADKSRRFFDTNVLVYLLLGDAGKSNELDPFITAGGTISVQVLNELTNAARRRYEIPVREIRPFLSDLRAALQVIPVTAEIHDLGLRLIERYNFSTYDAMIVAAALASECDVLLSEDMQHGMVVDGRLTIIDPFRDV